MQGVLREHARSIKAVTKDAQERTGKKRKNGVITATNLDMPFTASYVWFMRRKKLYRTKPELPFSLRLIRGAIGKEYVIKHYSYGAIKTKYPDMTKIIASVKQRTCRNLFQKAVAYAKEVIADPVQKAAWQKRLRRYNGVYNDAIKFFMLKDKRDKERADLLTEGLIRLAFKDEPCGKTVAVLQERERTSCFIDQKLDTFTSVVGGDTQRLRSGFGKHEKGRL